MSPAFRCAGAAHLARALREHTNDALAELDLGYNEIKDQGACAIAQVPCQHLEELPSCHRTSSLLTHWIMGVPRATNVPRALRREESGVSHLCCMQTCGVLDLRPMHPGRLRPQARLQRMLRVQALKANPERAPVELKVNANYITRFGQARCRPCLFRPGCLLSEHRQLVFCMGSAWQAAASACAW